jgi:hypothetical protein
MLQFYGHICSLIFREIEPKFVETSKLNEKQFYGNIFSSIFTKIKSKFVETLKLNEISPIKKI